MRRMTSRGVKCSPAVSFEISANLRISSSKTVPISVLFYQAPQKRAENVRPATLKPRTPTKQ